MPAASPVFTPESEPDRELSPWSPASARGLDGLLPVVASSSRAGYSESAVLRLINAMGPDLRGVLSSMAATAGELNAARVRAGEGLRDSGGQRRGGCKAADAAAFPGDERGAWAAWRVYWAPGQHESAQRERTEVTRGLEGLWQAGAAGRQAGPGEDEQGLVERELPTSDVEYTCMLVDELLSWGEARTVSYHRLCGRSAGGLLEDSILVRSTVEKEEDGAGQMVSSRHVVEAVEAGEWDRMRGSPETRSTYMELRSYLGEEATGEEAARTHRRDMLFGEDFSSLSATGEGRARMGRIRRFFEDKLSRL